MNQIEIGEILKPQPENNWGFPSPTIIIDSQSAPPLRGVEAEQRFFRMYLMGKTEDITIVNYPINKAYLNYLKDQLGFALPQIIYIDHQNENTLTQDILAQPEIQKIVLELITNQGYKIQFFNLSEDELQLSALLNNPTYINNIEAIQQMGTKAVFKTFCAENGITTPPGVICHSLDEAYTAVVNLKKHNLIIKANKGTGGEELGSNTEISRINIEKEPSPFSLRKTLSNKIGGLNPNTFPVVIEQKLLFPEASLHFFIENNGTITFKPNIFEQISHDQSYTGGYFPNNLPQESENIILDLANMKILPALVSKGLTGFHCMDFLYDPVSKKIFFIEDNTRPGALDFVHHFVTRVVEAHQPNKPYSWYHSQVDQDKAGIKNTTTFAEIQRALGNLIDPSQNTFIIVSNPDVLSYRYAIHLTGISTGQNNSVEKAEQVLQQAVNSLQYYYGSKSS